MAKRAGRVGFGSGQSDHGSKRVTGQNGSFLNGSIGLQVKRDAGQTGLTRFAMSTFSATFDFLNVVVMVRVEFFDNEYLL